MKTAYAILATVALAFLAGREFAYWEGSGPNIRLDLKPKPETTAEPEGEDLR